MEKVIKDGLVAVLISEGYGAGWYSWTGREQLLFHPKLVELVEQGRQLDITEAFCQELLGTDEYICVLGVSGLSVHWLPVGTAFSVEEYDGFESLRTYDDFVLKA